MKAIGGHERACRGITDEWMTPPEILAAFPPFDLDPCSPVDRPWDTAKRHYTVQDDGLLQEWTGRVWLNPPYGPLAAKWLEKLALHGDGIALVFARTETHMFHQHVWPRASAMLFIRGRLHFHHATGQRADGNAGAPSVLIAYGPSCAAALAKCGIKGHLIKGFN